MIEITKNNSINSNLDSKVTFISDLWIGMVKVPVRTELDFIGVHPSQHERILDITQSLYLKDITI